MGNSNSGSFNTVHSPPPWTQSLPRDAHRRKKYGVKPGTKVLPERIPGQRLRPTENGRILHHQGTISHRKLMESFSVPTELPIPKISQNHSTSMSALNLSPAMAPRSLVSEPRRAEVVLPQRKTFKSEPDLREVTPFNIMYARPPNLLHTIIHESPTKGKIMSKKRYKAPPPPPDHYNIEPPIQLIHMDKPSPITKSRKARIFKKNSTSKVKNDNGDDLNKLKIFDDKRRTCTTSINGACVIEETNKVTGSLDNLDYNMQGKNEQISYPMHLVSINTPDRNLYTNFRENGKHKKCSETGVRLGPGKTDNDISHIGDNPRSTGTINEPTQCDADSHFSDHLPQSVVNIKDNSNRLEITSFDVHNITSREYQVDKSRNSKILDKEEDPWDKAERELREKKRNSAMLQKEITTAAKKLKKVPSMSRNAPQNEILSPNQITKEQHIDTNIMESKIDKSEPKTFFFGMSPKTTSDFVKKPIDTELQINPVTIEKIAINDKIHRSSDSKGKYNNAKCAYEDAPKNDKKQITKKIDEFVANIERNKPNLKPNQADLLHSISHEDCGYHSRQSSETWQTENEKDENEKIRMNLRPTLPKRQLELPRFSPNAAWRSLGIETRSKENVSDTLENQVSVQTQEEKTHRIKHLASSRGSGEKSGDSGISGDGGSPGLVGDFEPIILKKRDGYSGVITISSPVSSTKLENKRTWTPAQDLEDNSFEDVGDQSSKLVPHDMSTFPKLTSRSNMFADVNDGEALINGHDGQTRKSKSLEKRIDGSHMVHGNKVSSPKNATTKNNLKNIENQSNISKNCGDAALNEDSWRENWSLSRSIPNSINKCGDNDCHSNSSYVYGTRSESRVSNVDRKHGVVPTTPSQMQHGNAGHIMYLPQYNTYNMKYKTHKRDCHSVNDKEDVMNFVPDNCSSQIIIENPARNLINIPQDKKKKFAYKSTIRMLEKRWLEEKLTKDAKEKEQMRVKEMKEVMKVEREFRNKREKEKGKLKKQLQLINSEHPGFFSTSNTGLIGEYQTDSEASLVKQRCDRLHSSPVYFKEDHLQKGCQSSSPDYGYRSKEHTEEPIGFISGMKKWARSRKKHSNGGGYLSDASSTTITSTFRQEPDGAPATSIRKNGENFREEIIASTRNRNGSVIIGESPHSSEVDSEVRYRRRDFPSDMCSNTSICTSVSSDQKRNYSRNLVSTKNIEHSGKRYMQRSSKSPAASESSMNSCIRSYSPSQRGTLSPDTKRSLASEPLPLAQEVYTECRDSRKHKDNRTSPKRPTSQQSNKYYRNVRDNELIDNYRRNFAQGQLLNYPHNYSDDRNRYTRQSSDGRSSNRNGESSRKNYSIDAVEAGPQRKSPLRQSLSYNYRVMPSVNSSPSRFAVNHLPHFNPAEEFRPVVFNSNKVLSV